ncbi:hypothetical protein IWQ61_002245 [Dispira simplex]|nr:hypothetical protein IWQ61_002245 [Dispira simplex]
MNHHDTSGPYGHLAYPTRSSPNRTPSPRNYQQQHQQYQQQRNQGKYQPGSQGQRMAPSSNHQGPSGHTRPLPQVPYSPPATFEQTPGYHPPQSNHSYNSHAHPGHSDRQPYHQQPYPSQGEQSYPGGGLQPPLAQRSKSWNTPRPNSMQMSRSSSYGHTLASAYPSTHPQPPMPSQTPYQKKPYAPPQPMSYNANSQRPRERDQEDECCGANTVCCCFPASCCDCCYSDRRGGGACLLC